MTRRTFFASLTGLIGLKKSPPLTGGWVNGVYFPFNAPIEPKMTNTIMLPITTTLRFDQDIREKVLDAITQELRIGFEREQLAAIVRNAKAAGPAITD